MLLRTENESQATVYSAGQCGPQCTAGAEWTLAVLSRTQCPLVTCSVFWIKGCQ
jgi:hypothetical protein